MGLVRRVTVLVTGLVLIAGCADDPEPKFAPDPSESPSSMSPSASVSPSPSESAKPADERTAQRDFIRAFVDEISTAISIGSPAKFLAMANKFCSNCRVIADNIVDAYADGGRIVGGAWAAEEVAFNQEVELGDEWLVTVSTSRERWLDEDDELIKIVRPSKQKFVILLADGPDPEVLEMGLG